MDPETNLPAPDGNDLPIDAVTQILSALRGLDRETRRRVLTAVATLLGTEVPVGQPTAGGSSSAYAPQPSDRTPVSPIGSFSDDRTPTAKQFLIEKRPKTEVDRVACLAFYVTHYKGQQSFKTLDLSLTNTEAAQPKFTNAAQAVDNAVRSGILLPVGSGQKQMSAAGELYVQQLPDYEAAKTALREHRQGAGRRR